MSQSQRIRVLSGVQPSGDLTIGNYLGALKQWVARQEELDAFYCVVDLHAITVPYDPAELAQKTREVAAFYLACGIDLEQSTIFVQSHVPAHSQLEWLLNGVTSLGWLNRMTQFKDKSLKYGGDSTLSGLLNYPVLMAADILLYQSQAVPVGDDQRQHIELTRDIAQRFNQLYGETFTIPEPMIPPEGARIMGLDNPQAKMSKSLKDSQYHAIYLLDSPDDVKRKVMKSVTDSGKEIFFSNEPERSGVNNLLTIYQGFTDKTKEQVEADFTDARGYGDLKKAVVEVVNERLAPIQDRYTRLMNENGYLSDVLATGAEKASAVAAITLRTVQERMGFLLPRA
jgi:tryptophanyl-tRNA synthetase